MGKRLLASFLAAAMMLTMAPFAFAVENTEDTIDADQIPATEEAVAGENQIETQSDSLLQTAIDSAATGGTVTMSADEQANITINKSITLNLAGHTLTNAGSNGITLKVTDGATVTVQNGTIKGGAGNYNIQVGQAVNSTANLTLENVIATAGNTGSSMIDNYGDLTINSGSYTGGMNTVKSEEGSTLVINDGTFTCDYGKKWSYTATILVYGDTTINGGTFIQKTTNTSSYAKVVMTGIEEGYEAITRVTDGTFTNEKLSGIFHGLGKATSDNFEVSGGTFNKSISDGYCADGFIPTKNADGTYGVKEGKYVAAVGSKKCETLADAIRLAAKGKTVKLLNDVDLPGNVVINKSITLDLNGKKIYNTTDIWHDADENDENDKNIVAMFDIKNGADVIITGNGTVEAKQNDCYNFNIVKGSLTIENGTFIGNVSAVQVQNGHLAIKGGKFDLLQKWKGKSTFLINCIDDAWADGSATVAISGGTFVNFDPAHGPEEGNPSFCAPGYKTELTNGVYVVKAGTNDAINALDAAVKAINNGEADKGTKVDNAIAEVAKIPNETLANNSTTMDKLAKLDNDVKTNGGVTVQANSSDNTVNNISATNAALSAKTDATESQTITIDVAKNTSLTETQIAAAVAKAGAVEDTAIQPLDITMKLDETEIKTPTAPVILTFDLPNDWSNAQIVYVDGGKTELVKTTVSNGKISGVFNHFSTYVLVQQPGENNDNEYQIILTPQKVADYVSTGDTITYNVTLKHVKGTDNDNIYGFRFAPGVDNGMMELQNGTPNDNTIIWNRVGGTGSIYEFNFTGSKELVVNAEMPIGTLTFKVTKDCVDEQLVKIIAAAETSVTNANNISAPKLSIVTNADTKYRNIKLTFEQLTGDDTIMYARYNQAGLYASLDDMYSNTTASVPTASYDKNSTAYRVDKEDTWYLNNGKFDTEYTGETTHKVDTTYVQHKVEIVKVTVPDEVTIDENITTVTVRGDGKYIDKGEDLVFTVQDPNPGMKNEVTSKVGNGAETVLEPTDGKYTVPGNTITDEVTIEVSQKLDMSASDIKIFTNGEGDKIAYKPYSTYGQTDTLVVFKGKTGANYTLGEGQPQIFKLPSDGPYDTEGDTGYTHAVLVPYAEVAVTRDGMLDQLMKLGLTTASAKNVEIKYDWKTSGQVSPLLLNVTATYIFTTNQTLKGLTPTDEMLLKADVMNLPKDSPNNVYEVGSYTEARDGYVSNADVFAFMYQYAKMAGGNVGNTAGN